MDTKAQLNNLRLAPRKVRAVSNLIKGKDVLYALGQLEAVVKRPGASVEKLLRSALANAENNFSMVKENLYVKSIIVNEGVKLKRFKPKGFGRVSPIQKKTSRINLTLAEKVPGLKRQVERSKPKGIDRPTEKVEFKDVPKDKKPEIKTELGRKSNILGGLGRRIFQRKAI